MKLDLNALKCNLLQHGQFKRITSDVFQYSTLKLFSQSLFTFRSAGFGFNTIFETITAFL